MKTTTPLLVAPALLLALTVGGLMAFAQESLTPPAVEGVAGPILPATTASGGAGRLVLRLRDSLTGGGVPATVSLFQMEGEKVTPSALSVPIDVLGRGERELPAGRHLAEVSAPGYGRLRTYFEIQPGATQPSTVWLDPEEPPEELRPDVVEAVLRPGHALLHGHVVDGETGEPLAGVRIRARHAAVEARTDERGYFALDVPAGESEADSELPATDDLIAARAGYKRHVIGKTFVTEGGATHFIIEMERGRGVTGRDDTHKLARAPEAQKESEEPAAPEAEEPQRLPPPALEWLSAPGQALPLGTGEALRAIAPLAVTVPASIRVGFNCPTSTTCTSVSTFTMATYVKRGLNDEWIVSWHANSLRAGAVAYRSFGAYFVAHPKTATYDICSTTACQVNDADTSTFTDAADTFTAGVVLTSGTSIVKSEYAAETTAGPSACLIGQTGDATTNWPCMEDNLCSGATFAGHERGMCQNGSQRWATGKNKAGTVVTKARDWTCILDHYYNDNGNRSGKGTGLRTAFLSGAEKFRQIAFTSFRDGNAEIYSMNADASAQTRRTSSTRQDTYPSWSPNGTRIAFASSQEIYAMNADGSGQTPLTSNAVWDYYPNWSPDGTRIVFTSERDGPNNDEIYVMNSNGSGQTRLTFTSNAEFEFEPSWSPDGARIAFEFFHLGANNIYVMNANGSGRTALTSSGRDSAPRWSPDGKRIAFSSNNQIYVMNANGSGKTRLTTNTAQDLQPRWSADGKRIAFTSNRDGNYEIYVMNADGTGQARLTTNTASDQDPDCKWCQRFYPLDPP